MFYKLQRNILLLITCLLIANCTDEEEARLPGERINFLASDTGLYPDIGAEDIDIVLPAPLVNTRFPQAGGTSDHAIHHLSLSHKPKEVWQAYLGDTDALLLAQPVVAEGRVFTLSNKYRVKSFLLEDGSLQWDKQLDVPEYDANDSVGGGIAFYGNRLFISTSYAQLIVLDTVTQEIIWTQKLIAPARSAPTVSGNIVLVSTIDNRTTAFNPISGEKLWVHAGFAESIGVLGIASPAIHDRLSVVAYSSGEIFALRTTNGRTLWSDTFTAVRHINALSSLSDIRAMPVIDRGMVLAVSFGGRMIAFEAKTGSRIWSKSIASTQMPWVAGDFIFVINTDSQLICLVRETGAVRWIKQLKQWTDEDNDTLVSWVGPILANGQLILTNQLGEVLFLSAYNGNLMYSLQFKSPVKVLPVIAEDTLLIVDGISRLRAFR